MYAVVILTIPPFALEHLNPATTIESYSSVLVV
jgi:hypothetical protein